MYEQPRPLATTGRDACASTVHRLEKRAAVAIPVGPGSTQHGSRLADTAQPPARHRSSPAEAAADMDGLCATRGQHRCWQSPPCTEERLAPLGDAAGRGRQSVHPEGQSNLVKPSGPVSTDNVLRLLDYQQHRCALTGRALRPETASLDHIIPIRCDGQHVIENTQVLHSDVNRAKGSLTNMEFIRLCGEVVAHVTAGDRG